MMRIQSLVAVGVGLAGATVILAFVGCATEGSPSAPPVTVVDAASGQDAGAGDGGAEAGRCAGDDCFTYPLDCSATTLCRVEVAFDQRADLLTLWASGPSDVWAAGSLGTVVHYDGSTWQSVTTGRKETFHSSWGNAPGSVWLASSNDFVLHAQTSTPQTGTWDVFDVYDGTNQACPISGLWGSATKGIWGALQCLFDSSVFPTPVDAALHSTAWLADGGPSWEAEEQYATIARPHWQLNAVFGFGEQDVWMGGSGGELFRRKLPPVPDAGSDAGVDETPVWAEVNSHAATGINSIGGTGSNDVWLVGDLGLVRHWDGMTMIALDLPDGIPQANLQGVWVTATNDVWIVGDSALLIHYDGKQFTRIPVGGLAAVIPDFHKVWASETTHEIWVTGTGILLGGKTSTFQ